MPEATRGASGSEVASVESATLAPRAPPSDFAAGPAERGASSTMVFHAPQASQRPDHLRVGRAAGGAGEGGDLGHAAT